MNIDLKKAVSAALNGDWKTAHEIAQESDEQIANWIHAVLHKIEGDEGNSRYWYSRARKRYEDFADSTSELKAIAEFLENKPLKNQ